VWKASTIDTITYFDEKADALQRLSGLADHQSSTRERRTDQTTLSM